MPELLIGCGNSRAKKIDVRNTGWTELVTVDHDPNCGADIIHDLEELPYPFADNQFDEIHAYEVLEHTGQQGDFRFFFGQFSELWRILKPGGILCISTPNWNSPWAWGDPSHKRIIGLEALTFLDQDQYRQQIGKTPMTDFRWIWKGDFRLTNYQTTEHVSFYVLRANKDGGQPLETAGA